MSNNLTNRDRRLNDLRQLATLAEYTFASNAPGVGGIVAHLREAWNSVATKWQVRPMMEQQSAFNRALVDWLAQSPGAAELDAGLIAHDRNATRLTSSAGLLEIRTRHRAVSAPGGHEHASPDKHRFRIAYFSPMPPSRSGIADYSAELLPHLAEWAEVTVFADNPESARAAGLVVKSPGEFPDLRDTFDLPVYQMGNSDQHETMYELLVRYPGVVVLHDYFLHHFTRHRTAGHGDWTAYGREMAYSLGSDGRQLARAVREGRIAAPLFDVPLNRRVIDVSLGLIVHSEFAAGGARGQRPDLPLAVVPALVEMRPGHSLRERLALPDAAVLFGSFGQITAEKQVALALRAFQRARENYPTAHFLLVGEVQPDVDLSALIAELGLCEVVHLIGYVADLDEFVNWIYTADVVVNLRQPTAGETSAIAMRAMAAARPLIVFDHGWYRELPDDATLKIAPGDMDGLRAAMEHLAASAGERNSMGEAGHNYVRRNCRPRQVARAYLDFLQSVLEPRGNG